MLEQSVAKFSVVETKMFPAPSGLSLYQPSTSSSRTKNISFDRVVQSLTENSVTNQVKGEEETNSSVPKSILKISVD